MTRFRLAILLVIVAGLSFAAGNWFHQKAPKSPAPPGRRILYYVDPMHPAYKSDNPGIAPDCGMELEPVYEDEQEHENAAGEKRPPGAVDITPAKQQIIGVKFAKVERSVQSNRVRLLGRVAADERRVYFLNAATDGWIRETFSNSTGSLVDKDEVLAICYAPEFLAAEQAYFYALSAVDRFKAAGKETSDQIALGQVSVKQAADGLRNLGMGEVQIQTLARDRRVTENIEIRSPAAGFVLERNVSPGLRFERGKLLYRIADLGRIWILADTFGKEAQYFRPGARVTVTLPNDGRKLTATVSDILPQFDPNTRTLKIRLETDNPGYLLRPDMFVDVELPIALPPGLSVPADAVIDSGMHKRVFVDRGNGYFEPRVIETGWRSGDRVQVLKGLMEGESVVVSGTFLVDSESRLKAAAAGVYGTPTKDLVCGMEVDESKASALGRKTEYHGSTYYFCSDECKRKFDHSPAAYLENNPATHSPAVEQVATTSKDPTCGMEVDVARARSAGRTTQYQGKTYYFCSSSCKEKFENNPEVYLRKLTGQKLSESSAAIRVERSLP